MTARMAKSAGFRCEILLVMLCTRLGHPCRPSREPGARATVISDVAKHLDTACVLQLATSPKGCLCIRLPFADNLPDGLRAQLKLQDLLRVGERNAAPDEIGLPRKGASDFQPFFLLYASTPMPAKASRLAAFTAARRCA